jgi:hypothetical protein
MTDLDVKNLVEQLTKQQSETLERLARMHEDTLTRVESQQKELMQHSRKGFGKKDLWDRFGAMAPITSALIIACTGAYFTYTYNQQQIKVQEIQTIEKFLPHLVGDEKSKRAAILAMNSLGNTKLAAKVAAIFASEGTASALTSMAKQDDSQDKEAVHEALYRTLDALAEKYKYENNFRNAEETYRKAVKLKETMVGKDSPELADSLDRLADLCDAHGDHASAQEARARIASIKKHSAQDANGGPSAALAATTEDSASSKGAADGALWAAGNEPRSNESSNAAAESIRAEQHEPSSQADGSVK